MASMRKILASILLFISINSFADVVVLVHGYDSKPSVWLKHGIYQNLSQKFNNKHVIYTAQLPNKAPIAIQANILSKQLEGLKKQYNQPIILVGHSAGGVVARYLTVHRKGLNIKGLITISAPHLGSNLAFVSNIVSGVVPFTSIIPVFDSLDEAKGLYGNIRRRSIFLKQLNHQQHPDICYVSIIREKSLVSDMVSMQHSQNMNSVPALRGKSYVIGSHKHHSLNRFDTNRIVQAINVCDKK